MISSLVWIVIVVAVASLALWAVAQLQPQEPINKVARIVIVCVAVLLIIGLAASIFGVNMGMPRMTQ